MVRHVAARRGIFLSILGISWFWLLGATFLAQFPAFAKNVMGGNDHVVTLFLTAFSIGIGIGSMLCNRLLKGVISVRYVPAAALAMTVFILDLYFATRHLPADNGTLLDLSTFLAHPLAWHVLIDLLLLSMASGFFVVPLNTLIQARSEPSYRARIIAANNILNALFMVVGAIIAAVLIKLGLSVPEIFLVFGVLNLLAALYSFRLLPETAVKELCAGFLRLLYRVELRGIENYAAAGERVVIVANHVSFLDPVLIAFFLPGRPTFAVDSFIAQRWWVKPFLPLVDSFSIDPARPLAARSLIKAVEAGRHCVIFPEGRITVTGALMKIYEGPGMIADKADAMILPLRIDGAQYTPFSRLKGKFRRRWFPKITLTLLPPRKLAVDTALRGRARRQAIGLELYDLMTNMVFATTNYRRTLFEALLEARHIYGGHQPIVEDIRRQPLSYNRLLAGSFALGRELAALSAPGERVGLLLPNSAGAAIAFFALTATGRVPALLNYSTGLAGMRSACRAAEIRTIVTARAFLTAAKLEAAAADLGKEIRILDLEDLARGIGRAKKLAAWGRGLRPKFFLPRGIGPEDPAVVLFTSGSEGTPKGVVLSHANILANRYQMGALLDFNPRDVVFNALPIFHSFGLTGGLLLPLLAGVKTFLYPSPLHYRLVPQLAYDSNATIFFGTDTFLAGYARAANAYDFYSLRYVFAGAERVRAETRAAWAEKFGLRILEGYGATEMSPVIAVNTPMQFKAGTAGRFIPGIDWRLEPVPGVAEGGRLILKGPNLMLGYLRAETPGRLEPPEASVYDTGDIVSVDARGFVTILGRLKRFAKVGGEMVSLAAVESAIAALWPDRRHAVIAVPDVRKGEQLLLVTEHAGASREELLAHAREMGLPELFLPRTIIHVERLPLLGSGKPDYKAIAELVRQAEPVNLAV